MKTQAQGEAVAEPGQPDGESDSLVPCPQLTLFIAVREGNEEEQRRKDY